MFSSEAREDWRWPDLQPLPASLVDYGIAAQPVSQKSDGCDSSWVELALLIVQSSLRCPGSRAALIAHALALLEPLVVRLRANGHDVPPFSITHVYFWIQLVHTCLTSVDSVIAQGLSAPALMKRFDITAKGWSKHYSKSVWNDISSWTEFACPDLNALPNLIESWKHKVATNDDSVKVDPIEPQQAMDLVAAAVADHGVRICEYRVS